MIKNKENYKGILWDVEKNCEKKFLTEKDIKLME